jgi:hypothetical protein
MTTENTQEGTPTGTEQSEAPQYTQIELEAIDQGWIPKEEFDGDPSLFIDAPEFVRRGELFRKIETQSREIKAVRNALEALKQHHTKVKDTEYNRALKSLQDARRQAVVEGEHERAFALEEKIDEIKEEKSRLVDDVQAASVQEDTYTPDFQEWVDRNSWYETNDVMRATADALGVRLHKQGLSPKEVLGKVEREIKKEFAHKFKTNPTSRPNPVETPTRSGGTTDQFQMTAQEKDIMRKIVGTGVMSEADYIKELKSTRK